MYKHLKGIIKDILPQKFLFSQEENLRKVLLPMYIGTKFKCNICETQLKHFEKLENGNLLCPICGSLPRTRRLWKLLNEKFLRDGISVLDFSPSRSIYRKLKKNPNINYFSTDFENEFLADYHFDITNIDEEDDSFNLILCYHILEHIPNDSKAMSELYRVLKKGGHILVQTPFKDGNIHEDSSIVTEIDREKHFGQNDHVRIYSIEGLQKRLKNAGFKTDINKFGADQYLGLTANECVIFCTK